MRKAALFGLITMIALALVACASPPPRPDANYAAYLELIDKQARADEARISSIAAAASACTDARCVEHVAAVAALAAASGSGRAAPQPFRAEPSLGKQIALALVGQVAPLASAAVSWRQSDNATRQAQAQYAYLGSVLNTAMTGMRDVAVGATPSITVGGNLGDTYGDNHTGGDRTQTDVSGHLISGDGTVIGDRNFNSGRQDSGGPFDRTCSGDGCQPVTPPDPTDPGT